MGKLVTGLAEWYQLIAEVLACLSYYYDYQEAIEKHFDAQEKAAHETAIPLDELITQLRKRKLEQS